MSSRNGVPYGTLSRADIERMLEQVVRVYGNEAREQRLKIFSTEEARQEYLALESGKGPDRNGGPGKMNPARSPLDMAKVREHLAVIDEVASEFNKRLVSDFTTFPRERLEADIAATAGLGGLMVFRRELPGMWSQEERHVWIYPIVSDLQNLQKILNCTCGSLGLTLSCGTEEVPEAATFFGRLPEITHDLEADYVSLCRKHNLPLEYYPLAALLSSLRIATVDRNSGSLDERAGISLIIFSFITGARILPYPPPGDAPGYGEWDGNLPGSTIADPLHRPGGG